MYESHSKLTTPDDSDVIWRYFDFAGFLSLISNGSLYFCRCDKFGDKWDAQYSNLPQMLRAYPPDRPENVAIVRKFLDGLDSMRRTAFVNCWHMDPGESSAMWEIYTARNNGIAISTTVGRLKEAFKSCSRTVWIGKVVYGDFDEPDLADHTNALPRIFVKRKEYEFEKEVRALVWSMLPPPRPLANGEPPIAEDATGFSCPVDARRLIESVVISPAGRAQIIPVFRSILDRFGMAEIPVRHSKLATEPPSLSQLDTKEPQMFSLSLRLDRELIQMLILACEVYHETHSMDGDRFTRSVDLINAIRHAATKSGCIVPAVFGITPFQQLGENCNEQIQGERLPVERNRLP